MPDYKEMYLHMMRATEKAIDILVTAQQECEEMYMNSQEPNLVLADLNLAELKKKRSKKTLKSKASEE